MTRTAGKEQQRQRRYKQNYNDNTNSSENLWQYLEKEIPMVLTSINNTPINIAIKETCNSLADKIKWAYFGSVAVVAYNGVSHRDIDDIDIIIEDNEEKLAQLFTTLRNCDRNGRKKRCVKVNNIPIEFMLMTGKNEIDLADGKFKFQNIEKVKYNNLELPVIDLQSLYCAKLRHKESLRSKPEMKNKLENCNIDIKVIQKILNS